MPSNIVKFRNLLYAAVCLAAGGRLVSAERVGKTHEVAVDLDGIDRTEFRERLSALADSLDASDIATLDFAFDATLIGNVDTEYQRLKRRASHSQPRSS